MIPVSNLIYGIDMALNKLSSLENQVIPIENKIIALNQAQIKLILSKKEPKTQPLGFESTAKKYEDIQVLIEPTHEHPLELKKVDDKLNKWSASLEDLEPEYMFYVESYIVADKEGCNNHTLFV